MEGFANSTLVVVGHMTCFLRSAAWVTGGFGQRFAGKNGSNYKCE